jgi:hypothetical protein
MGNLAPSKLYVHENKTDAVGHKKGSDGTFVFDVTPENSERPLPPKYYNLE